AIVVPRRRVEVDGGPQCVGPAWPDEPERARVPRAGRKGIRVVVSREDDRAVGSCRVSEVLGDDACRERRATLEGPVERLDEKTVTAPIWDDDLIRGSVAERGRRGGEHSRAKDDGENETESATH